MDTIKFNDDAAEYSTAESGNETDTPEKPGKRKRLQDHTQYISQEVVSKEFVKSLHDKLETEMENTFQTLNARMSVMISEQVNSLSATLTENLNTQVNVLLEEKLKPIQDRCDKLETALTAANANASELKKEMEDLKSKVDGHSTKIEENSRTTERLEYHSKKHNIIFEGVPERENEDCKSVVEGIIRRDMKLDMPYAVDIAHRLEKRDASQPAGLIARFKTVSDKSRIIQNSQILRGKDIYIKPDFPYSISKKRSFLAKSLKSAREEDEGAKLVRDKLLYKGKLYTVDNVHEAGIEERGHTVETEHQVRFYSYLSKYSNFYRTNINMKGYRFCSAEHAYQFFKADCRGDRNTARQILHETNPVTIKRLAKHLEPKNLQEEKTDLAIMYDVVMNKFLQNNSLAIALRQTTGKQLMECNPYDRFYSCGLRVNDARHADPNHVYEGKNHLGRILTAVRDKLCE